MKQIVFSLFSFLLISNYFNAAEANPCDSLEILYVGFNPLNPEEIIVYVRNTNINEIFSYPGFKLVDNTGDTVASETVDFFGIGGYSAHRLNTTLEDYAPGTVFNGTLLLYTGFYDSLVCSFPVSEILIPQSGCTDFMIYTTNYTGNIHQPLNWSVIDETGDTIFSGVHNYSIDSIGYQDSICLENGCYRLVVTADNPLEAVSDIGISFVSYYVDTTIQMNETATSVVLDFSVYYCDSTVSVLEIERNRDFSIYPNPANDILKLEWNPKVDVISLDIKDINGKVILNSKKIMNNKIQFDVSLLPAGIYFAQLNTVKEVCVRKFILQKQ